jgi:hypothetical protein
MTTKAKAKASPRKRPVALPSKLLDDAMEAAANAMKDAEKAYAGAGLDREAQMSLAEKAMREAGNLADDAVKTAIAQVKEAMDRIPRNPAPHRQDSDG